MTPARLSRWLAEAGRHRPPPLDDADAADWVRLALPLKFHGKTLGLWLLGHRDPDDFYPRADVRLLSTLADEAAIALQNAHLFATVQAELRERQQAEVRLRQVNTELMRSNADLEQFAFAASHDLQEPVRQVTMYAQYLARRYQGRLDADADELIQFVVSGAARMGALVKGLLDYSRLRRQDEIFVSLDSTLALQDALIGLQTVIQTTGATLTHEALPIVRSDRTILSRLFQNLISNALRFTRPDQKPQIHIAARRASNGSAPFASAGWWEFSVQDSGIGIAPEYFDRIFVMFQRLHTPADYPGTGIGLALCKRIVEQHGGRIWVESREGQGATFYFTLPAPAVPRPSLETAHLHEH